MRRIALLMALAETILLNGKIATVDRDNSIREGAWVSHDDDERGSLEVGKRADLAVLSKDYLTVPVEQVGSIESVLTMVGGKIVHERVVDSAR